MSHSLKNTKEYDVFDSFAAEARQFHSLPFFPPFLVEMSAILYKTDYFLVLPAHLFLSLPCIPAVYFILLSFSSI